MRPLRLLPLLALLALTGAGLGQDLAALPSAVDGHPGLLAAQASLAVAQLNRLGVDAPISLSADYSYSGFGYEDPGTPPPPGSSQQASVSATVRPFLFGDIRDLADQRDLDVLRAELALREARANLETQAIEAAVGLLLAQASLELADAGMALASASLAATQTRFDLGAAAQHDVDHAVQTRAVAEVGVLDARGDLALAEASLTALVGEVRLDDVPEIGPVQGTLPAVERSRYDVALAALALRNAERSLIPTIQATYTWNVDEDNTLSLSLESRTLQPTLSYRFSSTGSSAGPQLQTSFSIGLGVTLGPELFTTLDAVRIQLQAAQGALLAAIERAALTDLSLQNSLEAAQRQLGLAQANRALEAQALEDSRTRVALGLASDLETDRAEFSLKQADLELFSAQFDVLRRTLDSHRSYAIPLSEVLP